MCTEYKTNSSARFQILAKLDEKIFHLDDLANLWKIKNKNTLYTTIYRYVNKKLLFKIYKGFYALKPVVKLDPYFLGIKAMHQYAYISTETVLYDAGIIQQASSKITLVAGESRKFTIGAQEFLSRKMRDLSLYNPIGIEVEGLYKKALVSRAVADLLYYNKLYFFDNDSAINWKEVKEIQKELCYPVTEVRYK